MFDFTIGDVLTVDFPYYESFQSKPRPAIVINDKQIAVMCMYVTSKDKDAPYSIKIDDWKAAGLKTPSWARIDRVAPIDEYHIINRKGCLSDADFEKVFTLYKKYVINDIRNFSLIALKRTDSKFLLKYDERWECWLFPYFRSGNNDLETANQKVADIFKLNIETKYITSEIHCKFSESDKEYKIYNHSLYFAEIESVPEHISEDEFIHDDIKYKWMSIRQMENHHVIMDKNDEVVAFIKHNCK